MNLKPLAFPAAALLACLALACQKPATPNNQSKAVAPVASPSAVAPSGPIQTAVVTYLTKVRGLDLSKMSLEFKNQQIQGDKATCEVSQTSSRAQRSLPVRRSSRRRRRPIRMCGYGW